MHKKKGNTSFFYSIQNFLINLIIVIITFVICFWVLELYFRYKIKWDHTIPSAVNMPIFKESMYRSWDLKPNSSALQWYEHPTPEVNINSIWLRDNEIKEKDKKRILLLWDSFVFWMWAYQYQTISRFLNIKYIWEKYFQVINAWVIWQTIDDAYLYLKNDWIKLDPDIIVYNFFVWNDITELRRHSQTFNQNWEITKTSDDEHFISEGWFLRKKWKNEPKSYFIFWIENKIHWNEVNPTLTWPVFFPDNDTRWDPNLYQYWDIFVKILDQMNSYTKKNNIKFMVNIIPMDVQVSKRYWNKYPNMPFWENDFLSQIPQKRIINILKDKQINYVDLLPIFQKFDLDLEKDNNWEFLYYENDLHFNRLGNMYSAYWIYDKLLNLSYLK